ncbi:Vacuolar import and degradation protein 27 [Elsinoe australis]|uniref:Vacuolar import and degradation protein 27 n=1 Tax=Elsinoe australis TaxID=40998 RepID=A0A2P7YR95_9PEZI|nr:Vacuolar import and degradation protein 27 [Elsinoe australis]
MDLKCVDPNLQLDVDVMILDFLIYSAIDALLVEANRSDANQGALKADDALHRVNGYLATFNANHEKPPDLPHLQFRLQVLQFITLFYNEYSPAIRSPPLHALRKLRCENVTRAKQWHRKESEPVEKLFRTIKRQGRQLKDSHAYRDGGCYLLTILPLFMRLSIQMADTAPSESWMHLAASFMLQAALDYFINFRPCRQRKWRKMKFALRALREAFAWGCADSCDEGSDEHGFQDMLWPESESQSEDDGGSLDTWAAIREEYLLKFMPPRTRSLEQHIKDMQVQYPIGDFRSRMRQFLRMVAVSIPPPVLVQVEAGQLFGLSREKTAALKRRCGIDTL